MSSQTGLVLLLETKEGYFKEDGKITKDIEEAKKILDSEIGSKSALAIAHELGLTVEEFNEEDIHLATYLPSYESRIKELEEVYKDMGFSPKSAYNMAISAFNRYSLEFYDAYLIFKEELYREVMEFAEGTELMVTVPTPEKKIELCIRNKSSIVEGELIRRPYFSEEGTAYSYQMRLKNPHVEKYFDCKEEEKEYFNHWQNQGLLDFLEKEIEANRFFCHLSRNFKIYNMGITDGVFSIYVNETSSELEKFIATKIREYYSICEMHITRMFGSYILLQRKGSKLEAVKATPIPIQYCPLMVKLLEEVGGEVALTLLETLKTEDKELQTKAMCHLINEVVIKGGYFDTSRPLNSCEANVLFGASEIMSSAFKSNLIDAAVIVSNNLGTIITTNDSNTQGAVKRMTWLFYTSPSPDIIKTAQEASIIPVFPVTASIDQLEGVKRAISLGYKKIAVSVAADDNILHSKLSELEINGVEIYKFGLCSTGIREEVALAMQNHADVIWSCASKYVKELIEPAAIAQVGLKIPVHIMTKRGWELVKNHLLLNGTEELEETLTKGDEKPIYINEKGKIKMIQKKDIKKCTTCPYPCI